MDIKERTKFFRTIPGPEEGAYFAGGEGRPETVWFEPFEAEGERKEALMEQVSRWELVDTYRRVYEDLAYEDRSEYSGERVIGDELLASFISGSYYSNQVRGGYLFEDGRFAGYILSLENVSSYGMSVHQSSNTGILFTDGRTIGRVEYHYFHSSTETSREEDSVYSVRPKTTNP